MMRHCPTCAAPLPDVAPAHLGSVPYCSDDCVTAWFADGRHNRRQRQVPVIWDDRRSS